MSYYDKLRDERRKQILTTAKKMMCAQGVAGTNMSDLADVLKISRQTLYKYFNNIDEIAYAVQMETLEKMSAALKNNRAEGRPLERLIKNLETFLGYAETYADDFLFITVFDIHYNSHPEQTMLAEDYKLFFDNTPLFDNMAEDIAEGQALGEIRTDLSVSEICTFFINVLMAVSNRLALLGRNERSLPPADRDIVKRNAIGALKKYLVA